MWFSPKCTCILGKTLWPAGVIPSSSSTTGLLTEGAPLLLLRHCLLLQTTNRMSYPPCSTLTFGPNSSDLQSQTLNFKDMLRTGNGHFPLDDPLRHFPLSCSIRIRVKSGVSMVRVRVGSVGLGSVNKVSIRVRVGFRMRFMVWVRGNVREGKYPWGMSDTPTEQAAISLRV